MQILKYYNQSLFLDFVHRIKENRDSWRIVTIALTGETSHNVMFIAKRLKEYFGASEGVVFICNNREILVLVNLGAPLEPAAVSACISEKLPKYSCDVEASGVTPEGLIQIQVRLHDLTAAGPETDTALLDARTARAEHVVMIVDDDMFMRSLLKKAFFGNASIVERDDVNTVVETYLETLPDVLFLDIHMPSGSGIDLLEELYTFDPSAHVVILSSDSVKENVMKAKYKGVKGFLAKPFTQGKILEYFSRCPSVMAREKRKGPVKAGDDA